MFSRREISVLFLYYLLVSFYIAWTDHNWKCVCLSRGKRDSAEEFFGGMLTNRPDFPTPRGLRFSGVAGQIKLGSN
jgi:hypothetical protein